MLLKADFIEPCVAASARSLEGKTRNLEAAESENGSGFFYAAIMLASSCDREGAFYFR